MKSAIVAGALGVMASSASAGVNIVPAHWQSVNVTGVDGVLRAGSIWGPNSTVSDKFQPVNGSFQPEGTQWNNGSFWWDEDSTVNAGPVTWEVIFDATYTFDRFVIQADDNDEYRLEYLDTTSGQWIISFDPGVGLQTRDSGTIAPVTTDRLRFSAIQGDRYYSISELQAFAVPEPGTWAMMIGGFGLAGAAIRRRRRPMAIATA